MTATIQKNRVRNLRIETQRDVHPCTYSLLDPSDLACQMCGKKRATHSEQGFHGGNIHYDGTFETDSPLDLETVKPVTIEVGCVVMPFYITEVEFLADGFARCTVTATQIAGYPC